MARRVLALVLLLLGCAPGPGAAQPFDLGGPCLESGSSESPPYAAIREAAADADWLGVIALQKQSVRGMCSNPYRWFSLASAYLRAGQPDAATEVLGEAHRRGAEIKPATFEHRSDLAAFVGSDAFAASSLGQELAQLRAGAAARRREFQQQLTALPADERPPPDWIARGACPFECCTYRDWGVVEQTDLYDQPFGSEIVGTLRPGAKVRALTGNVHLRPAALAVIHDHPPLATGEIVFLLDYLGEGFSRYWRRGEVREDEISPADFCLRPASACWTEFIEPEAVRRPPAWWIQIETTDGLRGWTDEPAHFDNKDACG